VNSVVAAAVVGSVVGDGRRGGDGVVVNRGVVRRGVVSGSGRVGLVTKIDTGVVAVTKIAVVSASSSLAAGGSL